MRIDYLLDRIRSERERYYHSKKKSDQGRFYILDKLYQTIVDLEKGFDEEVVRQVLATLSQVQISEEQKLSILAKEPYQLVNPSFRVPVFPITFNVDNIEKDLLSEIYKELEKGMSHWLCAIPPEEIKSDADIKRWQRQMIHDYQKNVNQRANFTQFPVSFMRRGASNSSQASLDSQIQDYISISKLPPDAKLPAFHFITRCGGAQMKRILDEILQKQFGDLSKLDAEISHELNWTFNPDKLPRCDASLNLDLNSTVSDQEKENNGKKPSSVHHDPRLIISDNLGDVKEPDLQIKSKTTLTWLSNTIIPYINSIVITGRHANLLPLIQQQHQHEKEMGKREPQNNTNNRNDSENQDNPENRN